MSEPDASFTLLDSTPEGLRRGRLSTRHGDLQTPAFLPVGLRGEARAVTPRQLAATGAAGLVVHTITLSHDEWPERIAQVGGLHRWLAWGGLLVSDPAGVAARGTEGLKVSEGGLETGPGQLLGPEDAARLQSRMGADLITTLALGSEAGTEPSRAEVDRELRWATRARAVGLDQGQLHLAALGGGSSATLREHSARALAALDFDGYVAELPSLRGGSAPLLRASLGPLPAAALRSLTGVAQPEEVFEAVEAGFDLIQCGLPARFGRGGTLFTRVGRIRITDGRYRKDRYPVDTHCGCYCCTHYSRLVMRHLYLAKEPLYTTLATLHNQTHHQDLVAGIRASLAEGRYEAFKAAWLERLGPTRGKARPRG